MGTADEYAQWIVDNADKKGTPEFETIAQAYQQAKQQENNSEIEQSQNTGMNAADVAGMAVGAGQTAYEHVIKPVAQFAIQHPIETGVAASYLPESVQTYIPGSAQLSQLRKDIQNKFLTPNTPTPPATGPVIPQEIPNTAQETFKTLQTPAAELNAQSAANAARGVTPQVAAAPAPAPTTATGRPYSPQGQQFLQQQASPMAQPASQMTQAQNIVRKLALDKLLKGAGVAGGMYELGKGLLYTSPEEIATLKAAEARKRALGQ